MCGHAQLALLCMCMCSVPKNGELAGCLNSAHRLTAFQALLRILWPCTASFAFMKLSLHVYTCAPFIYRHGLHVDRYSHGCGACNSQTRLGSVQIRPYLQVWVGHQPLHHSNSMWEVTENIVNVSHKIGYWWLEQQILPIATQQQPNVNPRKLVVAQGNGT